MANANLHKAKEAKNDEFYMQLTDVFKKMMYFNDKIVFCNCDDPYVRILIHKKVGV